MPIKKPNLKVLVNAYACSPNKGSEPGMAWNWIVNLAEHCELHIITEGEFQSAITDYIEHNPSTFPIHFYYIPVSDSIRRMCWNQGDWRFYWHYRIWQKRAYKLALKIIETHNIDLIHQLNMIGFREPGFLWEIGLPFVWGPIGGLDRIETSFLNLDKRLGTKLIFRLKNFISEIQLKYSCRVRKALLKSNLLITATSSGERKLKSLFRLSPIVINETGCNVKVNDLIEDFKFDQNEYFNILWVGKYDERKQLDFAIEVISDFTVDRNNVKFHIVGTGSRNQIERVKNLVRNYDIENVCLFHGSMSHDKVQNFMKMSQVLLFTSIMEGTPHVVLEAISNKLPVLCFDICGQGDVVDETVGKKIILESRSKSKSEFVSALVNFYNNRGLLTDLAEQCTTKCAENSWTNKAKLLYCHYLRVIENSQSQRL